MPFNTLITPADLLPHLTDPAWIIVDCRFDMKDPARGWGNYRDAHIPSAVYAHLDEDMSGQVVHGVTGRHPLPTVEAASRTFGRLGVSAGLQVVAYDDLGGALAAARLWWLLRWLGHDTVAVLDGGWQGWIANASFPVEQMIRPPATPSRSFIPCVQTEMVATTADVEAMRQDPAWLVLDSRAADRYRGENETIDPVAGHIPGAVSCPFAGNLNPDGAFRSVGELRSRFERFLGTVPAERAVFYCGSGITAAHNILALAHAGLGLARLYAGSWSEWIANSDRPVMKSGERG